MVLAGRGLFALGLGSCLVAPFTGGEAIGLAELRGEMLRRCKAKRFCDFRYGNCSFRQASLCLFKTTVGQVGIGWKPDYMSEKGGEVALGNLCVLSQLGNRKTMAWTFADDFGDMGNFCENLDGRIIVCAFNGNKENPQSNCAQRQLSERAFGQGCVIGEIVLKQQTHGRWNGENMGGQLFHLCDE